MNIDHLEAFMYVVHLQSFHKASKALFLSQPTVTARIKTLERELNTELFERQGRGVILTQKGKDFIPYAQQIIQTFNDGKQQMKHRKSEDEIVIGANIITSQYFIPFALSFWKTQNPERRFKFVSATNDVLLEKLLNKQIDMAFMKQLTSEGIQQDSMLDNSVRLIVSPGHPLLDEQMITATVLADEPMVFFECGAFDWNLVYKLFEVEQVEPRIEFKVDHLEVAKSLIKNKHCIGFLPYLCVKDELARGELVEIDTSHLLLIKQHVYLTYFQSEVVELLRKDINSSIHAFLE
ncbi:LysR family transcriptional regulator [Viridibacillus sp. NPDC096237]|uniref:LysR family transcriptional regulator n=1 Tax=Viridibacillus sp. NPDC096237 TaxID=3390721 RepID=UPI003D031321